MDDDNVSILNIDKPWFPVQGNFDWPKRAVIEDSVMTGFVYNDIQIELFGMSIKDHPLRSKVLQQELHLSQWKSSWEMFLLTICIALLEELWWFSASTCH